MDDDVVLQRGGTVSAAIPAPTLVADIGGTGARFALAAAGPAGRPQIQSVREFAVAQFDSLAEAVAHYLALSGTLPPRHAVMAVASAITGDTIKITNNPWLFSVRALQRQLDLAGIRVINDFAAIGMAVPYLGDQELQTVGEAAASDDRGQVDRHYTVLGPGTGLGVCRLLLQDGRPIVMETEGGHIGFAPGNAYEIAVLEYLGRRHPRVSVERLVSGPGLQNLYSAVCAIDNRDREACTPEEITARARRGEDAACSRAVELFCAILGSFAGDVALLHGAWHGLYLGGGMTAKLLPWIRGGEFRRRFEAKGRFHALMRTIPTMAITHAHAGLLGAAACALGPRAEFQ